ncbi:MAG: hypothetical protein M1118_06955 [Chloroflexi bacterium]|nr:hypothetical protein [Chloroflexota bacterium]
MAVGVFQRRFRRGNLTQGMPQPTLMLGFNGARLILPSSLYPLELDT